jgi:uncharacterized protein YggU (UPF0235/DUF167 family)
MELPARRRTDGLELRVKVTPRAARDEIGGTAPDAAGATWLAVKVTAAPDAGKANKAVAKLLAERLGVAAGRVTLRHGAGARWKTFALEGEPAELERRLAEMLAGAGPA